MKWIISMLMLVSLVLMTGCGKDGRDGVDGINGTDGWDGVDGVNGQDGRDGIDGTNGVDGIDGVDGQDGIDGVNGIDGQDGVDGIDGTNGIDGIDGVDGEDSDERQFCDDNMSILDNIAEGDFIMGTDVDSLTTAFFYVCNSYASTKVIVQSNFTLYTYRDTYYFYNYEQGYFLSVNVSVQGQILAITNYTP